jgi:hypothetical protein
MAIEENSEISVSEDSFTSPSKRLENENPVLRKKNLTQIVNYYEDYKIEEIEMKYVPENLPSTLIFTSTYFHVYAKGINSDDIIHSCEILDINELTPTQSTCLPSFEYIEDNQWIRFMHNFTLHNTEMLIITLKYKRMSNQILYKADSVPIPFIAGTSFCNCTFTLPEGYKSLGLSDNILTKISDYIYIYYGECPTNQLYDELRFAPQRTYWKA